MSAFAEKKLALFIIRFISLIGVITVVDTDSSGNIFIVDYEMQNGIISQERYDRFCRIYEELKDKEKHSLTEIISLIDEEYLSFLISVFASSSRLENGIK